MTTRIVALAAAAVLAGCGLLQEFGPPRRDAGADAALDAPGLDAPTPDAPGLDAPALDAPGLDAPDPCAGRAEGEACDDPAGEPSRHLCLGGLCVPSQCGDGYLDMGFEECEPATATACDPATCSFECTRNEDCPSHPPCEVASCVGNQCVYATPSEPSDVCTIMAPDDGHCVGGLCVPNSCGDGVVSPGEQCDGAGRLPGSCTEACTFGCNVDGDCSDGDPCNGEERCVEDVDGAGRVYGRYCDSAWELPACLLVACHDVACVPTSTTTWECEETLREADGDGFAVDPDCGGDCDDDDPDVHPGALEVCNGIDDDCDGIEDEDTVIVDWCLDLDRDGFGDPATLMRSCAPPSDLHVRNCDDCFDDPTDRLAREVHPGQTAFFTEPYFPRLGSPSFDYDCDGLEALEHPDVVDCGLLAPILCERSSGWARTVPPCGTASYFATCRRVLACIRDTELRTQACR